VKIGDAIVLAVFVFLLFLALIYCRS